MAVHLKRTGKRLAARLCSVVLLLILCCLSAGCGKERREVVRVSFLDVGQGDCVLVESPEGVILLDTGTAAATDVLRAYLRMRRITRVDCLILSHGHDDHIGGADMVLSEYEVGQVFLPAYATETVLPDDPAFARFSRALVSSGVPVSHPLQGETLVMGALTVTFYLPFETPDGSNNDSLVVKFTYGGTAVLCMADTEAAGEKNLLSAVAPEVLSCDVLKVGHHGSDGSTTGAFLAAATPQAAVISCGVGNAFGHPSARVTQDLESAGVTVYRTDLDGTVIFELSQNGYRKVSK